MVSDAGRSAGERLDDSCALFAISSGSVALSAAVSMANPIIGVKSHKNLRKENECVGDKDEAEEN